MPFVRFSRDKKGYEHVYLMHLGQVDGRPAPRVLYWYRTPPGVKVGREPFDESVRRALEARYPDVDFDWPRIVNIPMPPPEAENWRERRRAERAIKQARRAEERPDHDVAGGADEEDERQGESSAMDDLSAAGASDEPPREAAEHADAPSRPLPVATVIEPAFPDPSVRVLEGTTVGSPSAEIAPGSEPARSADGPQERRRRRRRGGRRRRKQRAEIAGTGAGPVGQAEAAAADNGAITNRGSAVDDSAIDESASVESSAGAAEADHVIAEPFDQAEPFDEGE